MIQLEQGLHLSPWPNDRVQVVSLTQYYLMPVTTSMPLPAIVRDFKLTLMHHGAGNKFGV